MTIQERWKADSTKLGVILHKWIGPILTLLAIIGALGEYFSLLPTIISDVIPMWLKYTVLGAGIASHVIGKLTVAKKDGQV